jgi:DMSO/TMAO reductase YedYZ molybdopterin-dependent catalytic subunit
MRSIWPFALAGIGAAALALGAGEIAGAIVGGLSLIAGVGTIVIDLQPPGAKDLMVELFGGADKLALEVATGIGGLLVGALFGIVGRRDFRLAAAGFVVFGGLAFAILMRDPLASALPAAVVVLVAVATGVIALQQLLRMAAATTKSPTVAPATDDGPSQERAPVAHQSVGRRRFLLLTGSMLAVGSLLAVVGRYLTAQLPAIRAPLPIPAAGQPLPSVPPGSSFDVPGLTPIIVPNDDFYRIDTRLTVPRLDAETWTMRIHGMVDQEVVLSYADLAAMPLIERFVTIACVSNEVGGELVGNAKWTGVRLVPVLEQAGVKPEASQLVGRSFDGWTAGFPTEHLAGAGNESMIALQMNDEVLPAAHGFPARLIVPGLFGYVSATKWLTEIELTTLEAFDAYWVPLGWAKEAPILTQSRIDLPRGRAPAGPTTIAGVAWAPTRGISAVEVQIDDEPWRQAELSQPLSTAAWIQWRIAWDVAAGRHLARVRATDGNGSPQASERTRPAPDGARGYHEISFTADAVA